MPISHEEAELLLARLNKGDDIAPSAPQPITQSSVQTQQKPTISRSEAMTLLAQLDANRSIATKRGVTPEEVENQRQRGKQFSQEGGLGQTIDIGKSLGRGALQDFLDLSTGVGNIAASAVGKFDPKVAASIAHRPVFKAPDVETKAPSQAMARVGEFLDPALLLLPETKLGEAGALLGKAGKVAGKVLEPAALGAETSALESAGRTGHVQGQDVAIGAAAGTGLGAAGLGVRGALGLVPQSGRLLRSHVQKTINEALTKLKGYSDKSTAHNDIMSHLNRYHDELYGSRPDDEIWKYVHPEDSVGALYKKFRTIGGQQQFGSRLTTEEMSGLKSGRIKPEDLFKKISLPSYKQKAIDDFFENELKPIQKRIKNNTASLQQQQQAKLLQPFSNRKIENYSDAENYKIDLNKQIRKLGFGDPDIRSLEDLKDKVHETMRVNASGNPLLSNILKEADTRYAKEIIPFRKKPASNKSSLFWQNRIGKISAEDVLRGHIKGGAQADQMGKLRQLVDLAPDDETRNKMLYWWLKEGENNPKEFMKQWDKLGEGQKTILAPDHRDKFDELSKLQKVAPGAFREPTPREKQLGFGKRAVAGLAAGHFIDPLAGLLAFGAEPTAEKIGESLTKRPETAQSLMDFLIGKKAPKAAEKASRLLHRLIPSAAVAANQFGGQ